jgi:hypothetical protein
MEKGKQKGEFSSELYEKLYPDGVENHFWNFARNRIIVKTIMKYRAEPILDIGAGRGVVTCFLSNAGLKIDGVEIGKADPIPGCSAKIIYSRDVFSLIDKEKYRAVSLFDVIEHVEDQIDFLIKIRENFPNLSYIYITVPARMELWSRFDEMQGHKLRYDLKTLKNHLESAGYELIYSRYFFHLLYLLIIIFRKRRSERMVAPKNFFALLFHKILGTYFLYEFSFFPSWMPGSSMIAVATPKLCIRA